MPSLSQIQIRKGRIKNIEVYQNHVTFYFYPNTNKPCQIEDMEPGPKKDYLKQIADMISNYDPNLT